MRKGDVLVWGMEHIANNYGYQANTDCEEGAVCIYGAPSKVPSLGDVRSMCSDLGIPANCIYPSDFGIEVEIDWEWMQEGGLLQQEYVPTGHETWKKFNAVIGE